MALLSVAFSPVPQDDPAYMIRYASGIIEPDPFLNVETCLFTARHVCPKATVLYIVDDEDAEGFAPGSGIDTMIVPRDGLPLQQWRIKAMRKAALLALEGEVWLHVDYDTLFHKDPFPSLESQDFDIAQHKMKRVHVPGVPAIFDDCQQFNGGVTFGRGTKALDIALELYPTLPEEWKPWFGDQMVFGVVANKCKMLPLANSFNYVTPLDHLDVIPPNVYISHWKSSKRKQAQLDWLDKNIGNYLKGKK